MPSFTPFSTVFLHFNKLNKLKKIFILAFLFSNYFSTKAQFYYKDIVSNKQVIADMAAYKENKIRSINIKSYEDNGRESEGFFCEKTISKDYKKTELFTRADIAAASLFISIFDKDGKLLSTNDSSKIAITNIRYYYDEKDRVKSIVSAVKSKDEDYENSIIEEHIYEYENEVLSKMILIKNKKDSSVILFSTDANGNISIEKDTKTGSSYFYYYDEKNRLTDIVPQNEYTKTLKPDYIFEYNQNGQISQMTAVEAGSSDYFVWKYSYYNGLRSKEKCFTNEKKLMGSIEYEYK